MYIGSCKLLPFCVRDLIIQTGFLEATPIGIKRRPHLPLLSVMPTSAETEMKEHEKAHKIAFQQLH